MIRVGISGLLRRQFVQVEQRVRGNCRLIFLDKDKQPDYVTGQLDWLIMQRHISHDHWVNARSSMERRRVIFVRGGVSKVTTAVESILLAGESRAAV